MEALVSVPLSIATPPFCDGVPVSSELSTIWLSPMFTVFESTLVVVPCTVRLPTNIVFPATEISSPLYVIADDETTPLKFAANILLEPKVISFENEIAFPSENARLQR